MPDPTPDHVAVLLTQGRQWIADLADLGHWLDQREADALAGLQACPLPALADHVESLRAARWEAVTRAGLRPVLRRTHPSIPDTPEPPRRVRGVARHLYDKGKP